MNTNFSFQDESEYKIILINLNLNKKLNQKYIEKSIFIEFLIEWKK